MHIIIDAPVAVSLIENAETLSYFDERPVSVRCSVRVEGVGVAGEFEVDTKKCREMFENKRLRLQLVEE